MSMEYYTIRQHTIQVPRVGNRSHSNADKLSLAVKQYTPKVRQNREGLTIVAAHANACPKELYEPLWDRLHESSTKRGLAIRDIWIADLAYQGESGVLNAGKASAKDVELTDHSRDLLTLINHFKSEMRFPIIGLGHSMGGISIVQLSIMDPQLFSDVILIDPMIEKHQSIKRVHTAVKATMARKDRWSNREEARRHLRDAKMYNTWNPEVLDKYIEHGVQDDGVEVTLKTQRNQEVLSMVRPGFTNANGIPDAAKIRSEPRMASDMMRYIRPSILYVLGATSPFWQQPSEKIASMGARAEGAPGNTTHTVLEGIGHFIPMEDPRRTAETIVQWIATDNHTAKSWKL